MSVFWIGIGQLALTEYCYWQERYLSWLLDGGIEKLKFYLKDERHEVSVEYCGRNKSY